MRKHDMAIYMMLALGTICLVPVGVLGVRTGSSEQARQKVLVKVLLDELGKKYDRFFTIEEAWRDGESMGAIESCWLERSGQSGLQKELEHLDQVIPNFTHEVDKRNPNVVHIIDSRLIKQKEYGLSRTVSKIDFKGTGGDLVRAISRQGI